MTSPALQVGHDVRGRGNAAAQTCGRSDPERAISPVKGAFHILTNPGGDATVLWVHCGHMGNTVGPNGLLIGSRRHVSSRRPRRFASRARARPLTLLGAGPTIQRMPRSSVASPECCHMLKCAATGVCLALSVLWWPAQAQQPPAAPPPTEVSDRLPRPVPRRGNPTPGTEQPEPPRVADRIAVTGCLQVAPGAGAAPASAATTPASDRFVLRDARKDGRTPPDTGTSSAAASASSYRLEALDSQLSPFLDTRVELSGEVKGPADAPVLLVEFVRRVASGCQ